MTTTTAPERTYLEICEQAALDHVNEVRADLGLEPLTKLLPGIKANAASCPVATSIIFGNEALEVATYWSANPNEADTMVFNADDERFGRDAILEAKMSEQAGQFQRAFDRGEYPQLVVE